MRMHHAGPRVTQLYLFASAPVCHCHVAQSCAAWLRLVDRHLSTMLAKAAEQLSGAAQWPRLLANPGAVTEGAAPPPPQYPASLMLGGHSSITAGAAPPPPRCPAAHPRPQRAGLRGWGCRPAGPAARAPAVRGRQRKVVLSRRVDPWGWGCRPASQQSMVLRQLRHYGSRLYARVTTQARPFTVRAKA